MSSPPLPRGLLVYGAYGYTGRLVVEEALRQGIRPVLAGRDPHRLEAVAREVSPDAPLPFRVASLDDPRELARALDGIHTVLHAAGPFVHTAPAMLGVCLARRVHYIDLTGEVPVFELAFDLAEEAKETGIVLLPGAGMDVVPTDSAAVRAAADCPGATRLEIGLHSPGPLSRGTRRTIAEHAADGLLVRRDGRLVPANPGDPEFLPAIHFDPAAPPVPVLPYTWGDLSTAWRSTGIPHITCYMAASRSTRAILPATLPLLRGVLSTRGGQALAHVLARRGPDGPSSRDRNEVRVRAWARATAPDGRTAQVILETPEAYRFTAMAAVALAGVVGNGGLEPGTRTPAEALGSRWILGLPGVHMVHRSQGGPPGLRKTQAGPPSFVPPAEESM